MSNFNVHEGEWYADRATHDTFCVIHVDEIDELIDVRDLYGDIDEFDFEEWAAMDLELCVAPTGRGLLPDDPEEEDAQSADSAAPPTPGSR